jgi:hypothetical protein
MEDPAPLRAVQTPNLPALLRQLGASLLVTTGQAGKLVMVRDEGDHLNTHFRGFAAPMGMALSGDRLAVGTKPSASAPRSNLNRPDSCPSSWMRPSRVVLRHRSWTRGWSI